MSDDLVFTLLGVDDASPAFKKAQKSAQELADSLDKFGTTSLKAMGLLEAGSAGAAVAVGGSMLAMGLAFAGGAAYFASSNADVVKSFQDTSQSVMQSLERDTTTMVPILQGAAASLKTTYSQMEPLTKQAFAASGPYLATTIHGVEQLALNAMPGLVTSVKGAGPVFDGFDALLAGTGTGLGGFFKQITGGAPEAQQLFTGLGSTMRSELPALGGLLVTLGHLAADNIGSVNTTLLNVTHTIDGLAGGAIPVLGGGIGFLLHILDGLSSVLQPIQSELGGVIGVVLTAGAAFKVFNTVSSSVKGFSDSFTGLGSKIGEAAKQEGSFATKVGAMTNVLGGPFGLILGAVTIGLGLFGMAQQSAAEQTQKLASYEETLTSALRESNGVLDENVRKQAAADQTTTDLINSSDKFGFSSDQVVNAVLGQGQAYDQLKAHLQDIIKLNTTVGGGYNPYGDPKSKEGLNATGHAAQDYLDKLTGLNQKTKDAEAAQKLFSSAMVSTHDSLMNTSQAGMSLNADFSKLADTTSRTADKANALIDALDQLSGGHISLEKAQNEVLDSMDKVTQAWGPAAAAAKGHKAALVDVNGELDRTTNEGRSLFDTLTGLRDNTAKLAQSSYDMAIAQGKSVPEALDAARSSMQSSRDEAIKLAEKMGVPAAAAQKMADKMELIPDLVSTIIQTPGMDATQQELLLLKAHFDAVPGLKSITVQSLSDDAMAKLQLIGYTVTRLPDGRVTVVADTATAKSSLDQLTKPRTVDVYVRTRGPSVGSAGEGFAEGGFMPTGGPFMVGEQGPEIIFPQRPGVVMTAPDTRRYLAALRNGLSPASAGALPAATGAGGAVGITIGEVTIVIDGSRSPGETAEAVREKLLTLKRDLGGGSLGLA